MSVTYAVGPTGYTCWKCKGFVPNGCTHHCHSTAEPIWEPGQPTPPTDLERIAVALERIAAALENDG